MRDHRTQHPSGDPTLRTDQDHALMLADDPPDLLARKLLRVNLSDLPAMGAKGIGYLLSTAWTPRIDDAWIETFAACENAAG